MIVDFIGLNSWLIDFSRSKVDQPLVCLFVMMSVFPFLSYQEKPSIQEESRSGSHLDTLDSRLCALTIAFRDGHLEIKTIACP